MGLDYLHRVCKIIHTDLKPENCIVALGHDELAEIVKNGKIVKKRKKYEGSKNLILDDESVIIGSKKKSQVSTSAVTQGSTLLEGVNVDGMTKQ